MIELLERFFQRLKYFALTQHNYTLSYNNLPNTRIKYSYYGKKQSLLCNISKLSQSQKTRPTQNTPQHYPPCWLASINQNFSPPQPHRALAWGSGYLGERNEGMPRMNLFVYARERERESLRSRVAHVKFQQMPGCATLNNLGESRPPGARRASAKIY